MANAHDYMKRYERAPVDQKGRVAKKIFWELFAEVEELARKRQIFTNEQLRKLMDDQNLKWYAFAKLADDPIKVEPKFFIEFIKEKMPDLYMLWKNK